MAKPAASSSFAISSGNICFGALHNIFHGSTASYQQGFPAVNPPESSGTVSVQPLQYALPAQNGVWNLYRLINLESKETVGYFVAHEDVDPRAEIDKIIKVAPSPYESFDEETSRWNDEKSASQGVYLVNRYDWGYCDRRSWDDFYGEGYDPAADMSEEDIADMGSAVGVVDYNYAGELVEKWKSLRNSQRQTEEFGTWLWLKQHEYEFGRFGFDDEKQHARSFLFFSTYTNFTNTGFVDDELAFRKFETEQEKFERRLAAGWDFSGIDYIKKNARRLDGQPDPLFASPPDEELLGPFDPAEHILSALDVEALASFRPPTANPDIEVAEVWKDHIVDLVNQLAMSYMEKFVVPILTSRSQTSNVDMTSTLFPERSQSTSLDDFSYKYWIDPDRDPINGLDVDAMGERIRKFLRARSTADLSAEILRGVVRTLSFMVTELLELAGGRGVNSHHTRLVPQDVRLAVLFDPELIGKFKYSKVLWEGR